MKRTSVIASAVLLTACFASADFKSASSEAWKLQKEKKYDEAVAKFRVAFDSTGKAKEKSDVAGFISRSLKSKAKPQEAADLYLKILECSDISADQEASALIELGNIYFDMGKFDTAASSYKKVAEMKDAKPITRLDATSRYATALFRLGDSNALSVWESALKIGNVPANRKYQAVYNLVEGCVSVGDLKKLETAATLFNIDDPDLKDNDRVAMLSTLVAVKMLLGHYDDAIQTAVKISNYKPNQWQLRSTIAAILESGRRLGKLDDAIQQARSLMKDGEPGNAEYYSMFIQQKKEVASAVLIPLYEEALNLPNLPENRLVDYTIQLANIYKDIRQFDRALPLLEKAVASNSLKPEQKASLYRTIIWCYSDSNQPDMAFDTAKNAIPQLASEGAKFSVANDAANAMLGGVFDRKRNRFQQAYELLAMVDVAKLNDNEKLNYHQRMGYVCYSIGKTDKATEYYKMLIKNPRLNKWQRGGIVDSLRKMGVEAD